MKVQSQRRPFRNIENLTELTDINDEEQFALAFIEFSKGGNKKNMYFYPHLVDKAGGRPMWISEVYKEV